MATTQDRQLESGHDDESCVRVVRTRPGRYVFTEDGNPDAWIATDIAVSVPGSDHAARADSRH